MDADEGVEERERPEADQRELVAVDRIPDGRGQKEIDEDVPSRRDPEADDVVNEEPMPGRVVDPRDAARPEHQQDQIDVRPHERGDQVPEGDVEGWGRAARDRYEE